MTTNTIYINCPRIGQDRVSSAHVAIEKWIRSTALSALVEGFGSKVPGDLNLNDTVGWLLKFSERWDFRRLQQNAVAKDLGEGARWLLDDSQIPAQQEELTQKCARLLGLVGVGEPSEESYDYVLVLGGARLSCLLRPRLALNVVNNLRIAPKAIALLSSSRPVAGSERDATDTYAPKALSEFDLMNAGARVSFQMPDEFTEDRYDDPENVNKEWVAREYDFRIRSAPVVSISAPSSEPDKRRANSADTYRFFLSRFNVPKGSSLLLVTSEIYVPYQQLEAIRTLALPHDLFVETIGFPHEWGGGLQGMISATNYLQEIRSTIQSASRFIKQYPKRGE